MKRRRRVMVSLVTVAAVLVALGAYTLPSYTRATSFVVRAAGIGGWPEALAERNAVQVQEFALSTPTRYGDVGSRLYRPQGLIRRTVILVSGIHPFGIEEPRLKGLARDLAASGFAVLTPELPDLTRYSITPGSTDMIEDTARWAAGRSDLATGDGRIGLMGISFSGGLSVVAAGRPALRHRVAFAFSVGGHGNLLRVLRYLCTGIEPDGTYRKPHDYSLAVVSFALADELVPADQVGPLRHAIETFLSGSAHDGQDAERARRYFEQAGEMERKLPEPAAALMRDINTRNVASLGRRLLPHIHVLGHPSVSPEHSPAPEAETYLLHGAGDNVIPAAESELLARYLAGKTEVRLLISPLIIHAEVERPSAIREIWRLISFWEELLSE